MTDIKKVPNSPPRKVGRDQWDRKRSFEAETPREEELPDDELIHSDDE